MDNTLRIYAWFLLIVTALPAIARLARPLDLARILLLRYQDPKRRKRARIGGAIYLGRRWWRPHSCCAQRCPRNVGW